MKDQSYTMGIEEISRKSGLTKESIYRFTRMGLLPKPSKAGFRKSVYDEAHLNRLNQIRELREERKLSFTKIKTMLQPEDSAEDIRQVDSQTKKEQIMDKALEMFSKNGFANTRVSEITDELGVAKGTFYLYFNSKKDLFVECISRLTPIILPEETWAQIGKEDNFFRRQKIKLDAFLKAFPRYSGVLSLLTLSIQSDDTTVADKAKATYKTLADPVTRDLRNAVREGVVRHVNPDIMGLLLFGMAESLGYMAMVDSTWTAQEGAEVLLDFMANGLLPRDSAQTEPKRRWQAKDRKGLVIALEELRFGGHEYLSAILGEGQFDITVRNVQSIFVKEDSGQYRAIISHEDGEKITVSVDGELAVSGQSKLGTYTVPIRKLSEIVAFS